ncbi:ribonuclease P protein subunit p21-like [Rhopilema esculentum]|uniref:ribonuclease P protein subunit p21-like n=1 Tax=Rhopilema esculentum TaxID=499914 RepID=UPI0031DA603A
MVNSRLKMVDESNEVNVPKKSKKKQKSFFVPNREAYDRINFLYQAAHLTLSQNPENVELSRFYISTAKKITEKLVLKIDPKIKRTICKCCHALLIPGITSTHRLQGKREKHMVVSCLTCKTVKRWRTSKCNVSKDEALELDEK